MQTEVECHSEKFQLKPLELVQIRKWAPKFVDSSEIRHFGLIDQNVIRNLRCLHILRAEEGPRQFCKRYKSWWFKSNFDPKFQTPWQVFVSYIVLCSKYISFISECFCASSWYSVDWIAVPFHLTCIFFSFSLPLSAFNWTSCWVCVFYLFTNFPKSRSQIEYLKKHFVPFTFSFTFIYFMRIILFHSYIQFTLYENTESSRRRDQMPAHKQMCTCSVCYVCM